MLSGGRCNSLWVINCLHKLSFIPKQILRQDLGASSFWRQGNPRKHSEKIEGNKGDQSGQLEHRPAGHLPERLSSSQNCAIRGPGGWAVYLSTPIALAPNFPWPDINSGKKNIGSPGPLVLSHNVQGIRTDHQQHQLCKLFSQARQLITHIYRKWNIRDNFSFLKNFLID